MSELQARVLAHLSMAMDREARAITYRRVGTRHHVHVDDPHHHHPREAIRVAICRAPRACSAADVHADVDPQASVQETLRHLLPRAPTPSMLRVQGRSIVHRLSGTLTFADADVEEGDRILMWDCCHNFQRTRTKKDVVAPNAVAEETKGTHG